MKSYLIFFGLLIIASACNLLKNSGSSNVSSTELNAMQNTVSASEQKDCLSKSGQLEFTVADDSSTYTVQIWPKGVLTYSAENGFSGEAERMIMNEKRSKSSKIMRQQQLEEHDKGKVELKQATKARQ
jgi:hypothetical protein